MDTQARIDIPESEIRSESRDSEVDVVFTDAITEDQRTAIAYPHFSQIQSVVKYVCLPFFIATCLVALKTVGNFSLRYHLYHNFRLYSTWDSWKTALPPVSGELCVFYISLAVTIMFLVLLFYTVDYAHYGDHDSLRFWLFLLHGFLFILGTGVIAFEVSNHAILRLVKGKIFKVFTQDHYAVELNGILFGPVVDGFQKVCQCCGYRSANESEITYPAYYSILYWLETTAWGQVQAEKIEYQPSMKVQYAPKSCCWNRNDDECNIGIYADRLQWNDSKEEYWSKKIFPRQCNEFINHYNVFFGPGADGYMFTVIIFQIAMYCLSSVVIFMLKAIDRTAD